MLEGERLREAVTVVVPVAALVLLGAGDTVALGERVAETEELMLAVAVGVMSDEAEAAGEKVPVALLAALALAAAVPVPCLGPSEGEEAALAEDCAVPLAAAVPVPGGPALPVRSGEALLLAERDLAALPVAVLQSVKEAVPQEVPLADAVGLAVRVKEGEAVEEGVPTALTVTGLVPEAATVGVMVDEAVPVGALEGEETWLGVKEVQPVVVSDASAGVGVLAAPRELERVALTVTLGVASVVVVPLGPVGVGVTLEDTLAQADREAEALPVVVAVWVAVTQAEGVEPPRAASPGEGETDALREALGVEEGQRVPLSEALEVPLAETLGVPDRDWDTEGEEESEACVGEAAGVADTDSVEDTEAVVVREGVALTVPQGVCDREVVKVGDTEALRLAAPSGEPLTEVEPELVTQ